MLHFFKEGRTKAMTKRSKNRTKKKMLSALLTMTIMAVSLSGCGSTPANADNVVDSTEETVENSTESTVGTSNGTTTEAEIKDGAVAGSDKPAEPTAKPTAEPTATEKPEPTATPEPTAPPHTHDYKVESTVAATCAAEGKVVKVCVCGDKTEEVLPVVDNHNWTEITTLVHHDSLGHTETIEEQVQVGTTEVRHEYECSYCKARFDTPESVVEHCKATGDFNHAFASTIIYDYPGEPIYETQTKTVWVVDQEAYDTVEVVGYKCSVCGATK